MEGGGCDLFSRFFLSLLLLPLFSLRPPDSLTLSFPLVFYLFNIIWFLYLPWIDLKAGPHRYALPRVKPEGVTIVRGQVLTPSTSTSVSPSVLSLPSRSLQGLSETESKIRFFVFLSPNFSSQKVRHHHGIHPAFFLNLTNQPDLSVLHYKHLLNLFSSPCSPVPPS